MSFSGFSGVRSCSECGRLFDLWEETDAAEWYGGHDCELGQDAVEGAGVEL